MNVTKIIDELENIGYSQAQVARDIGTTQPTLNRQANSHYSPKAEFLRDLLCLYARECGNAAALNWMKEEGFPV